MSDLVYIYANWAHTGLRKQIPGARDTYLKHIVEKIDQREADGIFIICRRVTEYSLLTADKAREAGLDIVWGYNENPEHIKMWRFDQVIKKTRRIALCSVGIHEWIGTREIAEKYLKAAKEHDFEWICVVTHRTILEDLRDGGRLRDFFLENNTFCICLCGYVLAGYLFDDERMPHMLATSLKHRNLHKEFGVTVENLTEYLEPLNIISGAGTQEGLNMGSRVYVKRLGFKGIVCGTPFDLTGTDNIEIKSKPERYPEFCGGPEP